ncbi:hypothetical protein BD413DRAFT_679007 [Trametes elegans]|nr:hypothetical protein BD413DRAFT_679007 [Trametes elegans]
MPGDPIHSPSWQPTALPPDMDDHSTAPRPSPLKRLARRMGLSSADAQALPPGAQGSYNWSSASSGSLAKSSASTTAPTAETGSVGSQEPGRASSLFSRRRKGPPKEELPDIADMLEDDNLAWVRPPPRPRKPKGPGHAHS